jgi:hypothetical protein
VPSGGLREGSEQSRPITATLHGTPFLRGQQAASVEGPGELRGPRAQAIGIALAIAWSARLDSIHGDSWLDELQVCASYSGQTGLETEPGIAFSHSSPSRFRSRSLSRPSRIRRTPDTS